MKGRALITGGTSGLGAEFAKQLAARGLDLVLVGRNEARLAEAQTRYASQGVDCEILPADLATPEGVAAVKERLVSGDRPVSVFVNNAGAGLYSRLAELDVTAIREGTELMALVPMELGGAAAHAMKERGEGWIITTASVAAVAPMGAYSAVKAYAKMWSDSLAAELAGTGVQVTTFIPGWVRTEFHQRTGVSTSSVPTWLWLNAERTVSECLAAVEKGKTTAIPSKRFKLIVFLAKHAPAGIVAAVGRKLNKGRR